MNVFPTFRTMLVALVLAAVVSVRLANRTGLPSLLLFLAIGLVMGESGLGIDFSDYDLARDAVVRGEGCGVADEPSSRRRSQACTRQGSPGPFRVATGCCGQAVDEAVDR